MAGRLSGAVLLVENILAGRLLAQVGISSPDGEMTVTPANPKDHITLNADGSLSGNARGADRGRFA